MRLADIWREKITCIIHTSTQEEANMLFKAVDSYDHNGTTWASWWNVYKKKTCYRTNLGEVVAYGCMDNYIEDGEEVIEFSDLVATGGTLPTSEWSKLIFKNGSSIEILPQKDDTVRGENHFCDGFRDRLDALVGAWAKLGCTTFNLAPDEVKEVIKKTEEKKMPTKFTFYFNVNEGTRIDKSCNGTIPTITTSVVLDKFGNPDRRKCYSLEGEATCDKADYDMRQGVLEALANAVFDGNFEKAYDKAVKTNAFCERQDRTCTYCGKVCDTIEDKNEHEAWHVERKKARRERYLLRKRAKEIAFEEQAQKMAKEMIKEDK